MTETVEKAETTDELSQPSAWVRVSRYAALTVVVWSVALQILAGDLIPPVLVIGIVFAAFVPFLSGGRRRLAAVAGALALLAIAGNLPGTIDELSHPSSAPAFILTLLVTLAAAVAIVAGVAALRRADSAAIRPLLLATGTIFVTGVFVAVVASAGVESSEPLASDIQVIAVGVQFDPGDIGVAAGETGFWVDNQDGIRHTFTIEGTNHEIDLPGLSSQRADFELAPGVYNVFCAVPGHENMKITLTVEG